MLPCPQPPTLAITWLKANRWSYTWHAQKLICIAALISRDSSNVHFCVGLQAKQKTGLNGGLILVIHYEGGQHGQPKYWKFEILILKVCRIWRPKERLYGNRFFENRAGIRDAKLFQYLRRPHLAYWLHSSKNNLGNSTWGLMGGKELVAGSIQRKPNLLRHKQRGLLRD